jgi:hypothetical protein
MGIAYLAEREVLVKLDCYSLGEKTLSLRRNLLFWLKTI